MQRLTLFAALLALGECSHPLKDSDKDGSGYCYGYFDHGGKEYWCWLTEAGGSNFVQDGDGGYSCESYDGYNAEDYCEGAAGGVSTVKVHTSKRHVGAAKEEKKVEAKVEAKEEAAPAAAAPAAGGSPWAQYLASLKGKTNVDWKKTCGVLNMQAAGMGMGSGGGYYTWKLTCNSDKVVVKCKGKPFEECTSPYVPKASWKDTPPPGKYNVVARKGTCGGFTQAQVQEFLNIHNKLRCAVGADPVEWSGALQCQAQSTEDEIRAFEHSDCYSKPIPAGENLATGRNLATAAWMWFLEYLNSDTYYGSHDVGHFTAMSWKSVDTIGCGIGPHHGKDGKGVIRCMYSGGSPAKKSKAPNFGGSSDYAKNVPPFYGKASQFKACGLPVDEIRSQAKMQAGWGILSPSGTMRSNLGLYDDTDGFDLDLSDAHRVSVPLVAGGAFAAVAAMALVVVGSRRYLNKESPTARALIPVDGEDVELMAKEPLE